MRLPKKIAIIGPESTGKSSLCQSLGFHFKTRWVPEYAREYLLTNGAQYTYDDLLTIARGQLAGEDRTSSEFTVSRNESGSQPPPLFIDTEMYVMKVWCEFVFGKCHQFILDQINERKYDLYLLCNTDLLWVKDELREYPDLETREKLYHTYKDIMVNQSTPWVEIRGDYEKRLRIAIAAVDKMLKAS